MSTPRSAGNRSSGLFRPITATSTRRRATRRPIERIAPPMQPIVALADAMRHTGAAQRPIALTPVIGCGPRAIEPAQLRTAGRPEQTVLPPLQTVAAPRSTS